MFSYPNKYWVIDCFSNNTPKQNPTLYMPTMISASKMITFDSFTLIPTYSDITSRNEVSLETNVKNIKTSIPIINANMLAVCTPELVTQLLLAGAPASYHRFFPSLHDRKTLVDYISPKSKNRRNSVFISLGAKEEEMDFVDWLASHDMFSVIIDVNHGHHKMVSNLLKRIKDNHSDFTIMAGNVSSTDGIKFLLDNGADIIKVGNSFGFSCTTIKATGFGVHPLHTAKTYREETGDWDACLCIDGGIRDVADIAKSLIWGNIVMLGKMFAGTDLSAGRVVHIEGQTYKEYYGNASAATKKQMALGQEHVKYIEGDTKLIPFAGSTKDMLSSIEDGLRSAFSFVGARSLEEYQRVAPNQILLV